MRPTHHLIVSGIAGLSLLQVFHSWTAAIACLVGGVLIDVDHLLDYFLAKKEIPFSYKKLLSFCAYDKAGRLFLVFHGIEYIFLLSGFLWFYPNAMLIGFTLGVSLHLFCDQLINPFHPFGYFIVFRMKKNFLRESVFTQKYVKEILQLS